MCLCQNGYTPLHIAAKKDEIDVATALLEYGAKPNAESKVTDYLLDSTQNIPVLLI